VLIVPLNNTLTEVLSLSIRSAITGKLNVSEHMLIWTLFLLLVCGDCAQICLHVSPVPLDKLWLQRRIGPVRRYGACYLDVIFPVYILVLPSQAFAMKLGLHTLNKHGSWQQCLVKLTQLTLTYNISLHMLSYFLNDTHCNNRYMYNNNVVVMNVYL
jgi:hypothetical protein